MALDPISFTYIKKARGEERRIYNKLTGDEVTQKNDRHTVQFADDHAYQKNKQNSNYIFIALLMFIVKHSNPKVKQYFTCAPDNVYESSRLRRISRNWQCMLSPKSVIIPLTCKQKIIY